MSGGHRDQADGFELVRIVDTADIHRAGRRLGVVGVDGGRLVPVDGGLPVDVVPAAVVERIVSEHRPRITAAGVTVDGVEWRWSYS